MNRNVLLAIVVMVVAAAGIYTYTVKRTDDLPRALGGRGELVAVESTP